MLHIAPLSIKSIPINATALNLNCQSNSKDILSILYDDKLILLSLITLDIILNIQNSSNYTSLSWLHHDKNLNKMITKSSISSSSSSSTTASLLSSNDEDFSNLIILSYEDHIVVKDIYDWKQDKAHFNINMLMKSSHETDDGLIS